MDKPSYNLYGARKTSTDTTGNPFAYNGEARDDTGLDYSGQGYLYEGSPIFLTVNESKQWDYTELEFLFALTEIHEYRFV